MPLVKNNVTDLFGDQYFTRKISYSNSFIFRILGVWDTVMYETFSEHTWISLKTHSVQTIKLYFLVYEKFNGKFNGNTNVFPCLQ